MFKNYFNQKFKLMIEGLGIDLHFNTFSHANVLWAWSINATKVPTT